MSAQNYLVISALGKDRPGIVDELSKAILDIGCNIADSRMTVLGGEFAILLLVEGNWSSLAKMEEAMPTLERQLDLTIIVKRTEGRDRSTPSLPYVVDVISLDHPGIVHQLANFFSTRRINIEDMATTSYAAPHTGTIMFSVHMTVGIPADIHIASLREDFMEFCDAINLDAIIEPAQR
ncbi:glycine cleavage system protein R [Sedimenticola hydrogenitrophicus]|jgi:glycine cleavage system transcriptional repressor|uniref:glycine cleavage system protein R n=1 Tax=Sedimenticola hydrogenitrophicus TaxID=2967975 RepID=UPI0023AE70F2|nr:glycine cleavage system protein R [Sedimenticola hydrogenitrophicus]